MLSILVARFNRKQKLDDEPDTNPNQDRSPNNSREEENMSDSVRKSTKNSRGMTDRLNVCMSECRDGAGMGQY